MATAAAAAGIWHAVTVEDSPGSQYGCYRFGASTWRTSLGSALAAEDLDFPDMTGPAGTTAEFVGLLCKQFEAGDFREMVTGEFEAKVNRARVFICSDRHTYCLSAITIGRFLDWLLPLATESPEDTLIIVEWIPQELTTEFARIALESRGHPDEATRSIARFLRRVWPFPVQDHARALVIAAEKRAVIRGAGGPQPAKMPDLETPDAERFPVAFVSEEDSVRLFQEQDDRVIRETIAWLDGGEKRKVVILNGASHTFARPSGIRLSLELAGYKPVAILNGVAKLDRRVVSSLSGPPSDCWLDFGNDCYYGPLLSETDWQEYLRRKGN